MGEFQQIAAILREAERGRGTRIPTPFGPRLLHYADLTATGRHLDPVERFVDALRPVYANTHTAVATTGRVMNGLREEARAAVARSVNAGPEDVVLFTGSGATAAVNKLVGLLGLRIPEPLEREFGLSSLVPAGRRPVILVGPYEHHSNVLPWMESIADVEEVALDARGAIDLDDLRRRARAARGRPLVAGAFSAASNVDGLLTDVAAVARVLHEEGALAFVDYAAGGPYLPIDMHPADPLARLDAVFVSTHKFLGGPEGSGVLVAHRALFRTRTPERPGGGTVDYVSGCRHDQVDYVHKLSEREEGGTPGILGDVRAGIAFALKDHVGAAAIRDHDVALARAAVERLDRHPRIRVYGPLDADRLPILSFNVDGLHHDLVSALLDHLFGIQNRAGCSCAGPYGHRLLGISGEVSERYRKLIAAGVVGAKPGWVRVSLPWYAAPEDVEFTLRAVEFVADRGDAFVPLYRLDWRDGVWRHRDAEVERPTALRLDAAAILAGTPGEPAALTAAERQAEREAYLAEAVRLADALDERWRREPPAWNRPTGNAEVDRLVWFRYVETEGMPG
ncbi:MAG TPA: aminotransferase class V-fold PLP-dependent enzyme [Anaeromyxobacteraceae bacterium]|nr:aminotransferase class V-fold PLP-dependent enzyme [Anaeromyxobacteraceae bacterium]